MALEQRDAVNGTKHESGGRERIREQFLGPRHLMQQGSLIRSLL